MKACGHFDASGEWVQLYNGTNETISPEGKAQWAQDVVAWTHKIAAASRKVGMLMIPKCAQQLQDANSTDTIARRD